jgi:hypothetical protein
MGRIQRARRHSSLAPESVWTAAPASGAAVSFPGVGLSANSHGPEQLNCTVTAGRPFGPRRVAP